jgi:hypothetical protein
MTTEDERQRRDEAVEAVRQQAAGKTRPEIRDMLLSQFESRSVAPPPDPVLDLLADSLSAGRNPIRHGRVALGTARMMLSTVKRSVTEIKDLFDSAEPFPHPPGKSTYLPAARRSPRRARVALDPDAASIFPPSGASAQPGLLSAWLQRDGSDVTVHVGGRRIGVLGQEDVPVYAPLIDEAASRGQVLAAMIIRHQDTGGNWKAEVGVPAVMRPLCHLRRRSRATLATMACQERPRSCRAMVAGIRPAGLSRGRMAGHCLDVWVVVAVRRTMTIMLVI